MSSKAENSDAFKDTKSEIKNKKSLKRKMTSKESIKPKKLKLTNKADGKKINKPHKIRPFNESPHVTDPLIRLDIQNLIRNRNCRTLCISNIPRKCSYADIEAIAPEMQSCRIPYNVLLHINCNVAFIEFESEELCDKYKQKLDGLTMGSRIIKVVPDNFYSDSVDDYHCRSIVLCNVNQKIKKGEIAKFFPKAISIALTENKSKFDKRMPGLAYVTFLSEQEAMDAIKARQGFTLRGKKISMMFQKKTNVNKKDVKCLIVLGINSKITEKDLRAAFPQVESICINENQGSARLIYDLSEDCLLDYGRAKNILLNGHKITVAKDTKFDPSKVTSDRIVRNISAQQCNTIIKKKIISTRLFVKNLSRKTTEDDLRSIFPGCKSVTMTKKNNSCVGYAFIDYETEEAAKTALDNSNSPGLHGKWLQVSVAVAKVKEEVPVVTAANGKKGTTEGKGRAIKQRKHQKLVNNVAVENNLNKKNHFGGKQTVAPSRVVNSEQSAGDKVAIKSIKQKRKLKEQRRAEKRSGAIKKQKTAQNSSITTMEVD